MGNRWDGVAAATVVAGAVALGLSGCTAPPDPDLPGPDDLVGATGDLWLAPDGSMSFCEWNPDPGFSGYNCENPLPVLGLSPSALEEDTGGFLPGFSSGESAVFPDAKRTILPTEGLVAAVLDDGTRVYPVYLIGTIGVDEDRVVVNARELGLREHRPAGTQTLAEAQSMAPSTPEPTFASVEEIEAAVAAKEAELEAEMAAVVNACPTPAGGWVSTPIDEYDRAFVYGEQHPDTVLGVDTMYGAERTRMSVISLSDGTDSAPIIEEIGLTDPDSYCFVETEITRDDVDRVVADPAFEGDGVSSRLAAVAVVGRGPDPELIVRPTVLTSELVEAAARYPDGLVRFDPRFERVFPVDG